MFFFKYHLNYHAETIIDLKFDFTGLEVCHFVFVYWQIMFSVSVSL